MIKVQLFCDENGICNEKKYWSETPLLIFSWSKFNICVQIVRSNALIKNTIGISHGSLGYLIVARPPFPCWTHPMFSIRFQQWLGWLMTSDLLSSPIITKNIWFGPWNWQFHLCLLHHLQFCLGWPRNHFHSSKWVQIGCPISLSPSNILQKKRVAHLYPHDSLMIIWLVVEPYPSEKHESQLGLLFPIYGKIKKRSKPPIIYNHQFLSLGALYLTWFINLSRIYDGHICTTWGEN